MKTSGKLPFTQMGISLFLHLKVSDIPRSKYICDIVWRSRTKTICNTDDNGNANALHLQHAAQIYG